MAQEHSIRSYFEMTSAGGFRVRRSGAKRASDKWEYSIANCGHGWAITGIAASCVCCLLNGNSIGALALAYSPNGNFLAAFGCDGSVSLWDLRESNPLRHELKKYSFSGWPTVTQLAFSSDSTKLASGGGTNSIIIWDTEARSAKYQLATPEKDTSSLAFDPYHDRLAIGQKNGNVILWNYEEKPTRHLSTGNPCLGEPHETEFGVRMHLFKSLDKLTLCYTLDATGVQYHAIRVLGFPHDRTHILSISGGKELVTWKIETADGEPAALPVGYKIVNYAILKGHLGSFDSATFSPDYGKFLTAGADGSVVVWSTGPNRSFGAGKLTR
jgi:WD40 repeat protein